MKNIDLVWSCSKDINNRTGVVSRSLDDIDAFFNNHCCVTDIIWRCNCRQKSNVYPEGLRSHLTTAPDPSVLIGHRKWRHTHFSKLQAMAALNQSKYSQY